LAFYAFAGFHVDSDAAVLEELLNPDRFEKLFLFQSFLTSRSIKERPENVHAWLFFALFRHLRKASLFVPLPAFYQRGNNYSELHLLIPMLEIKMVIPAIFKHA
jgi:hypothetical protein